MSRLQLSFCLSVVALAPFVAAETVQLRTFTYRATTRVSASAQEAKTITNPLNWPHVRHVVPDGSFVEKGSIIVEFDRDELEYRLADAQREATAVQAELRRKLTELENGKTALSDELAGLTDQLAVFQTQLERSRALPDPDDVAIARGRLKVARLAADAAEKDLETATDRLQRKMISQAEAEVYERAHREAQAQLRYRQDSLDLVSEGAQPTALRKIELQIANLELDISRTTRRLEENEQVSSIEQRAAQSRADLIGNQIAEAEKDLGNTQIAAPISGHVVYMPIFRQRMDSTGDRMWKGFSFLRMPDPDTIVFKGTVLESERRYFEHGDQALVSMSSRPGETLEGEIVSFSEMPHDRGETDGQQALQQVDSGVMVYDVVVQVEQVPAWVQVGASGECELVSSREEAHPAVSAAFARIEAGASYLAVEGVYRPVEGRIVDGFLILDDQSLLGQEVTLFGHFPEQLPTAKEKKETRRFTVTAELEPADTADVVVGEIHRWQKISWLTPEDTRVQKDDVVAQLDTAETEEEIKRAEGELQRLVSSREKEEEAAKMRVRQNHFSLERARNLLEIAVLDQHDLLANRMTEGRLTARLNAEMAAIRYTFLKRQLKRVDSSAVTSRSPAEIANLRRDCRRSELRQEAARIRLDKLERGADELALAAAERTRSNRELTVATETSKGETDEARFGYQLRIAQSQERRARDRVGKMKKLLANLTLKAPRGGLVQYEKAWQGGVWVKVTVGSQVGQRATVMKIADVSRMYVRAELPEKVFQRVRDELEVDVSIPALSDTTLKGKVTEVEFLFNRKRRKDSEVGLYSGHEALGETVFYVRVELDEQQGVKLKPGVMAEVIFPFKP